MKLCYRGVQYNYNSSEITTYESEIIGKYRGSNFKLQNLKEEVIFKPDCELKYRGVIYQSKQLLSKVLRQNKTSHHIIPLIAPSEQVEAA